MISVGACQTLVLVSSLRICVLAFILVVHCVCMMKRSAVERFPLQNPTDVYILLFRMAIILYSNIGEKTMSKFRGGCDFTTDIIQPSAQLFSQLLSHQAIASHHTGSVPCSVTAGRPVLCCLYLPSDPMLSKLLFSYQLEHTTSHSKIVQCRANVVHYSTRGCTTTTCIIDHMLNSTELRCCAKYQVPNLRSAL